MVIGVASADALLYLCGSDRFTIPKTVVHLLGAIALALIVQSGKRRQSPSGMQYFSGDDVQLGDVVDINGGTGPEMRVVAIIPSGDTVDGFDAEQWAYLRKGLILQDVTSLGLLHVSELNDEHILVQRA